MKRNKNRKGFTIVELVIVIALIGILATVLVPTFGDVIEKANQAKDIQTVKNMNTALAVYSATMSEEPVGNSLIQDVDDVMDALAQAGFDTAKELTPVTEPVLACTFRNADVFFMRYCKVPSTPAIGRAS